jgi:hypothetical protein
VFQRRGLRKVSVLIEHWPREAQFEQRMRAAISSSEASQVKMRASASGKVLRAWPQLLHVTVIRY